MDENVRAKKSQTLLELLAELFSGGNKEIEAKLDKVLANQAIAAAGQKALLDAFAGLAEFLGAPGSGSEATPDQLAALEKLRATLATSNAHLAAAVEASKQ